MLTVECESLTSSDSAIANIINNFYNIKLMSTKEYLKYDIILAALLGGYYFLTRG